MRPACLSLLALCACATLATAEKPAATGPWSFDASSPVDVPALRTKWTPEELKEGCAAAEKLSDQRLAEVAAIPNEKRSFANTADAIEQIETEWGDTVSRLSFMKDIHQDARVRAAAAQCEEDAGKYGVKIGARKDLFLAMKGWLDGTGKTEELQPDQKRLVEIAMREFHRAGLDLPDAQREKLVQLRSRLAELQTRFGSNLDEDTTSIELDKAELTGLPESFLARLKPGNGAGKVIVTTKYPDYYPVMENCTNEAARKKMETAFMSRAGTKNVQLLDEAISLRDEAAHLLGYATHADFVTEPRMAKSASAVAQFEERMQQRLKSRLDADTAKMEALKAADTKQASAKINSWDWRFYLNQLRKRDFSLDDEQTRAYFPADKVLAGMLKTYATVLGIEFSKVPSAETWASGVELYEIHDAQSKRLLAKFYVDLFPREGKYGHAASFGLGPARAVPAGYQIPLSVLVVNFEPPQGGKVAHLSLNEVDTLFHEFGHIMHQTLTTARYATLSGSNVATDFVEAPSQMLENFVFEPEILALVSEPLLPAELMKRMAAARRFDAGVRYSRQVFLGSYDLYIHTHGAKVSSEEAGRRLWAEIMTYAEPPDTHFAASFGHTMSGYDAGYYGYLWSEVFSADMFTRFQKEGVLNPKTGRDYRNSVLAKGRTEDPDQLLQEFLGRPANEDAFLKQIGIEAKPAAQR